MEKWTLWLALEAATVMTIASLWFLWRGFSLRKKLNLDDDGSTTTENNQQDDLSAHYQSLADELENQALKAVDKLKALRGSDDLEAITQYKVWGTLAKAESSILVNDATDDPKPILQNFMASIVGTLETVQSRGLNHHTLTKNIKDLDAEFIQASELLISKEELIANQKGLHNELRKSIDRATMKVSQMAKKSQELQRLTVELKKLQRQVKELESHESSNELMSEDSSPSHYIDSDKHQSTRHLQQLERLSQRQQAIIEHLQGQLEDEGTEKENENENEQAREQALSRMERLDQESQSLVKQLQNELDTTSLTISALRDDISLKEAQLKDLDKQIKEAEGGVLGGFQTLSSNKRNTLEAIIGEIESIKLGDGGQPDSLLSQEKEVSNLEQMLKESETCVQLLVQEVETAEAENEKLRNEVETKAKNTEKNATLGSNEGSGPLAELNNLRDQNRLLVSEVQDLQETLVSQVSDTSAKALRNEYNKKSLELDRLQLAYSDLERKYLGTLR